jgi:hypothetical protein
MLNQLAAKIGDARNFQVDVGHVALFGLCAGCGGHEIESDGDTEGSRDIQAGSEAGCS